MMKLRAPAYPLITVDPYFSIWSMSDNLNRIETQHWTGSIQRLISTAEIDGTVYCWMGNNRQYDIPEMRQVSVDYDALSTTYTFFCTGVLLTAKFLTPLIPDDMMLLSRPVSFLDIHVDSIDDLPHDVRIEVFAGEEICLDHAGQYPVCSSVVLMPGGISAGKTGSTAQPVLQKKGDDLRIDWGYFYMAAKGHDIHIESASGSYGSGLTTSVSLKTGTKADSTLILFAYDDLYCLEYFGKQLKAYWKRDGITIEDVIAESFSGYPGIVEKCSDFSSRLYDQALSSGGEYYAELLSLAFRQIFASHKLASDTDGNMIFISKECFSNGCAATVDVSYPSIPIFLIYAPELIKGMMRPIFRFAESDEWPFAFSPHDAGLYPILNGQVYSNGTDPERQMPVEECGNMLIMSAAVCLAERNTGFFEKHISLLRQWVDYLLQCGVDPENQLCTDDFAGHLAHNSNLSIKAIMAVASYGILSEISGDLSESELYFEKAREMAIQWHEKASDGEGMLKLAFDQPGSFSMKYNAVWDKIFDTGIFPKGIFSSESSDFLNRSNRYGPPLDNRADYTKSDWLVWTAALADDESIFRKYIKSLWDAYNESESRVPLTDFYDTKTAGQIAFQHRSVQGGLFIKLLDSTGICARQS